MAVNGACVTAIGSKDVEKSYGIAFYGDNRDFAVNGTVNAVGSAVTAYAAVYSFGVYFDGAGASLNINGSDGRLKAIGNAAVSTCERRLTQSMGVSFENGGAI